MKKKFHQLHPLKHKKHKKEKKSKKSKKKSKKKEKEKEIINNSDSEEPTTKESPPLVLPQAQVKLSPLASSPSPSLRSRSSSRSPIRYVQDDTLVPNGGQSPRGASSPPVSPIKSSSDEAEEEQPPPPPPPQSVSISASKKRKASGTSSTTSTVPSSATLNNVPSKRPRKSQRSSSESPQGTPLPVSPLVSPLKSPIKSPPVASTRVAQGSKVPTPNSTNQQNNDIKSEEEEEEEMEVKIEGEDYQKDFPVQGEVNHQKFMPVSEFTPDYVKLLQAVQNRIENPQENDNLESIVKLVQKTECYALDSECVKFDLCLLDKRTVIKITKELGISVK